VPTSGPSRESCVSPAWTTKPSTHTAFSPHLILEKERTLHCDLIVLGKAKRSEAKELFLGSVSRHVLADGRSDVLVVAGLAPPPLALTFFDRAAGH